MKRRSFILLSLAAAGAASLPVGCRRATVPGLLGEVCDEQTLRGIGHAYLQQHPAENNRRSLEQFTSSHSPESIRQEFRSGKTVVVKGWVLSLTEARQCALLTLQS